MQNLYQASPGLLRFCAQADKRPYAANGYRSSSTARHVLRGLSTLLAVVAMLLIMPAQAAAAGADTETYSVSPRFGTRKAELSPDDRRMLDEIVARWRGREGLSLQVVGHTDNIPIAPRNRGEYADNQVLSEARARTVARYLGDRLGIPAARVVVAGMGDRQPVASNATPEGRARNRRVDVTLTAELPRAAETPAPATPVRQETNVLDRARALIDQRQPAQAMALLSRHESELIGTPEFDYLYGLAALESNEMGEAMFALQRAVEMDPAYAAARMELARAHFQTGDLTEAKRQFELLASQNPPPAARAAIKERLAMIERMQALIEPRTFYYVRTAGGYDSNANSATSLNSFLGFDLSEQSQEASSSFADLGGGVRHVRPQSKTLVLDTRLDLTHRSNFEASFVDSTSARFGLGLRQEKSDQVRSLNLQAYRQQVDGSLNSQGAALTGQWNFNLGEQWQLGVFGRVGTTRYGDDLEVKDVYEYLGGVSAAAVLGPEDQGVAGVSLLYGMEDPIQDGSRYARDLYGLRAFANWAFSSRLQGRFSAGVLKSDYEEVFFPLEYSDPREDTLFQGQLGFFWKFKPEWVLNPALAYYRNSSDVSLFEFDRFELSVSVSRLW